MIHTYANTSHTSLPLLLTMALGNGLGCRRYECAVIHWWASGRLPSCGRGDLEIAQIIHGGCRMEDPQTAWELMARPVWLAWFVLAIPLTTQFRGAHFFCVHRLMHPWWKRENGLAQGDIGAFLYRHVHSLHHKSYNPGPWSSLSMHPVEHIFYFSCFFLAFLVPMHPLHLLLNKCVAAPAVVPDLAAPVAHHGSCVM